MRTPTVHLNGTSSNGVADRFTAADILQGAPR